MSFENHQRYCEAEQGANADDGQQTTTTDRQGLFMRGSASKNVKKQNKTKMSQSEHTGCSFQYVKSFTLN